MKRLILGATALAVCSTSALAQTYSTGYYNKDSTYEAVAETYAANTVTSEPPRAMPAGEMLDATKAKKSGGAAPEDAPVTISLKTYSVEAGSEYIAPGHCRANAARPKTMKETTCEP